MWLARSQLGLSWIPAAWYICLTASAWSLPSRKEMEVEEATARTAPAFAGTSKLVTGSTTQRVFCVIVDRVDTDSRPVIRLTGLSLQFVRRHLGTATLN